MGLSDIAKSPVSHGVERHDFDARKSSDMTNRVQPLWVGLPIQPLALLASRPACDKAAYYDLLEWALSTAGNDCCVPHAPPFPPQNRAPFSACLCTGLAGLGSIWFGLDRALLMHLRARRSALSEAQLETRLGPGERNQFAG